MDNPNALDISLFWGIGTQPPGAVQGSVAFLGLIFAPRTEYSKYLLYVTHVEVPPLNA